MVIYVLVLRILMAEPFARLEGSPPFALLKEIYI